MKFDLMYLLSVMMLVICAISLGYTALRCLKGSLVFKHKIKEKLQKLKALDYKLYIDIRDYVTYEKYQIWRFYFPA